MHRDNAQRGYELFQTVLEQPPEQREAFLTQTCREDPNLRNEVQSLLAAEAAAGSFLQLAGTTGHAATETCRDSAVGPFQGSIHQDLTGRQFSHYYITRCLGAGGIGAVYLAEDVALGRPAAVKILRPDLPSSLQQLLVREGDANSRLQHPAIATFYESGVAEEVAFIAMEYVRGRTLRECLAEGPLPTDEALAVGTALLQAVAHAHGAGVVHGDIKPENVLRTSNGQPKLLDFGLSRLIGEVSELSEPALAGCRLMGTAGYLAPEVLSGAAADIRSDVFSLGAVLYEAVSGRRAFPGATAIGRLFAVLNTVPEPLRNSKAAERIWPVLAQALARSPADRFRSAAEFLKAWRSAYPNREPARSTPGGNPAGEAERLCQQSRQLWLRSDKALLEEAAELLSRALQIEPRYAPAMAGLAAVHGLRFTFRTDDGLLATATDYARKALAIDPRLADAYVWLGYALYNQGKQLEGYECAQKALELDPANFLAHYFAATPLCFSCTRAEAAALQRLAEPSTPLEDSHRWRWRQATTHFRSALRINPRHGWSWLGLGWCHTELEDYAAARQCLQQAVAIEKKPGSPTAGAAGYLGESLRRSGRLAEARDQCLAGLEAIEVTDHFYRDTWRGVCLCALGRTALDQGDTRAAEAAFTQAVLHIRGRMRARAGGHVLVQALSGLARARQDTALFEEAVDVSAARDSHDFRWLWTCSEDIMHLELARAARAFGHHDHARAFLAKALDYGSAEAAREVVE